MARGVHHQRIAQQGRLGPDILLERAVKYRREILAQRGGFDVAYHPDDLVGYAASGHLLRDGIFPCEDALHKGSVDDGGLWTARCFPSEVAARNARNAHGLEVAGRHHNPIDRGIVFAGSWTASNMERLYVACHGERPMVCPRCREHTW